MDDRRKAGKAVQITKTGMQMLFGGSERVFVVIKVLFIGNK